MGQKCESCKATEHFVYHKGAEANRRKRRLLWKKEERESLM